MRFWGSSRCDFRSSWALFNRPGVGFGLWRWGRRHHGHDGIIVGEWPTTNMPRPRAPGRSRSPVRGASSNHAALGKIGDLILRVAEPRQDLLVGLAELGRRAAKRQALFAVRNRVAEDREVAEHRRVDGLGH